MGPRGHCPTKTNVGSLTRGNLWICINKNYMTAWGHDDDYGRGSFTISPRLPWIPWPIIASSPPLSSNDNTCLYEITLHLYSLSLLKKCELHNYVLLNRISLLNSSYLGIRHLCMLHHNWKSANWIFVLLNSVFHQEFWEMSILE